MLIGLFIFFMINYVYELNFYRQYGKSSVNENSNKIGEITLYTSPVFKPTIKRYVGHSWIYIYNTSETSFFINGNEVKPNEGISMGTTAMPEFKDKGIWFNIEGYNSTYLNNVSITGDFYEEDLEYLNNYLLKHDRWNIFYNCSTFASRVWNGVSAGQEEKVKAFTPRGMYIKIKKIDDYDKNKEYDVNGEMIPLNKDN